MKPTNSIRLFGLIMLIALAPGRSWAQDGQQRGRGAPAPGAADEKAAEKDPGPVLAIVGADVETVTRGTIRRGTILVRGGKILAVGQAVEVPEGAEVIDARGKVVTPGFVALEMSRVGVGPAASSRANGNKVGDSLDPFDRNIKFCLGAGITAGAVQVGGASGVRFRFEAGPGPDDPGPVELTVDDLLGLLAEEQLDRETLDHLLSHAAGGDDDRGHDHDHGHAAAGGGFGLFAGGDGPGMASPFDGRFFGGADRLGSCEHCAATVIEAAREPFAPAAPARPRPNDYAVLKLTYGEVGGMLASEAPFYGLSPSALSGPFNVYSWRDQFKKARDYMKELKRYEADKAAGKEGVREPRKPVDDGLIRLAKGEIPLRIRAESADQIRGMVALAKELDYRLVIDGAGESWLVAEELGKAGVPVVITPRNRRPPRPGREGSSGTSAETPGILQKAAVPFAIAPLGSSVSLGILGGLAGRDLTSLPLEAAFAVRGGADEATALAALTIVPARILGLDGRIGSIEEGKDADLLILDGPPLDYRTYVETAIVDGKVRYRRAEDRVYPVFDRDGK